MKDVIDTSYNRLLDASEITATTDRPHKEKLLNKTTEIHKAVKHTNLKNSSKLEDHSYLSTPMILIRKLDKNSPSKKLLKRKNKAKEDPKNNLKYGLKHEEKKSKLLKSSRESIKNASKNLMNSS